MDTNGFMPPTYFHRIGAQMRQETDLPNVPVCAAASKIFDVFGDGLKGLGAGLEVPVMYQFIFEQSPEAFHGGVVVAVPPARHRWHSYRTDRAIFCTHGRNTGYPDPSGVSVRAVAVLPPHPETAIG